MVNVEKMVEVTGERDWFDIAAQAGSSRHGR